MLCECPCCFKNIHISKTNPKQTEIISNICSKFALYNGKECLFGIEATL